MPSARAPHGVDQLERRAHGALGIVLVRDRRAPDGHHRVADELLDGAAVAVDDVAREVEVACVSSSRTSSASRRSANGVNPTRSANRTETSRPLGELGTAMARRQVADLCCRLARAAAGAAGSRPGPLPHSPQNLASASSPRHSGRRRRTRASAFFAELSAGLVRRTTCRADHSALSLSDHAGEPHNQRLRHHPANLR